MLGGVQSVVGGVSVDVDELGRSGVQNFTFCVDELVDNSYA